MKPWYTSKTIWVNIMVAVLASLEATTGILKPYLPDYWYVFLAVGLPVINIVLRIVTTQPIGKANVD
jgi:hypothetical protein